MRNNQAIVKSFIGAGYRKLLDALAKREFEHFWSLILKSQKQAL